MRAAERDPWSELRPGEVSRLLADVPEPYYSYEMNGRDVQDILAAIREGKMRSDFITFAVHSHDFHDTRGGYRGPGIPEEEHLDTNPSIADYLPELARAAIDNGADVFQGTGVHVLRASRSIGADRSSMASGSSSGSATSGGSPGGETQLETAATAVRSRPSTRAWWP